MDKKCEKEVLLIPEENMISGTDEENGRTSVRDRNVEGVNHVVTDVTVTEEEDMIVAVMCESNVANGTEAKVNDEIEKSTIGEKPVCVNEDIYSEEKKKDVTYQKDLTSLIELSNCNNESKNDENTESVVKLEIKEEALVKAKKAVSDSADHKSENEGPKLMCDLPNKYRKPPVDETSESEDSESSEEEEETSSSSSSVSSSSSSDESGDSDSSDVCVVAEIKTGPVKEECNPPRKTKTEGELGIEDLPPIEDLYISVPEAECVEIGNVLNIVESLVVVQSLKGSPALDLDSVLFLDKGQRPLGVVFDVFGPVKEPCYCVRFNSNEHAVEKGVEKGMSVYFAPRTEHSKFVFVAELLKMKGSDASWENNNEPPAWLLDYSDDEREIEANKDNEDPQQEDFFQQPQTRKRTKWNGTRQTRGRPIRGRPNHSPNPWGRSPGRFSNNSQSHIFQRPQNQPRPGVSNSSSHFHNRTAVASPVQRPTINPWAVPPPQNLGFLHSPQSGITPQNVASGVSPFMGQREFPQGQQQVTPPGTSPFMGQREFPQGQQHIGPGTSSFRSQGEFPQGQRQVTPPGTPSFRAQGGFPQGQQQVTPPGTSPFMGQREFPQDQQHIAPGTSSFRGQGEFPQGQQVTPPGTSSFSSQGEFSQGQKQVTPGTLPFMSQTEFSQGQQHIVPGGSSFRTQGEFAQGQHQVTPPGTSPFISQREFSQGQQHNTHGTSSFRGQGEFPQGQQQVIPPGTSPFMGQREFPQGQLQVTPGTSPFRGSLPPAPNFSAPPPILNFTPQLFGPPRCPPPSLPRPPQRW